MTHLTNIKACRGLCNTQNVPVKKYVLFVKLWLVVHMSLHDADLVIHWPFPFILLCTPPFPAIEDKASRAPHVSNTVPFLSPCLPSHLQQNQTCFFSEKPLNAATTIHVFTRLRQAYWYHGPCTACFRMVTSLGIWSIESHHHSNNQALTQILYNKTFDDAF